MMQYLILINRQGKLRLSKWFEPRSQGERSQIVRDITQLVLPRSSKMCNVVEYGDSKLVYKRYASLYFLSAVSADANELEVLQTLHLYVETLDRYFGSVCELDLIFNMSAAHYLLDELLLSGQVVEPNRRIALMSMRAADGLAENVPAGQAQPLGTAQHDSSSSRRR
mmetsp:Transcript_1114/g.2184  ORF Transcript_1114/g.2184 Transcript_1114/m.2184 type:complete len:167 (-) Transcript_1114:1133-1633(-)